jgi:hypothetical protein
MLLDGSSMLLDAPRRLLDVSSRLLCLFETFLGEICEKYKFSLNFKKNEQNHEISTKKCFCNFETCKTMKVHMSTLAYELSVHDSDIPET